MTTEQISRAPDSGSNEDLVAAFESAGLSDLLVLDGATSVADTDYIDPRQGDVAWFVGAFAAALEAALAPGVTQAVAVRRALDAVSAAYRERAGAAPIPVYAHPLAALTWIRIRHMDDHLALSLYCLGDCKVFALDAAGAVLDLDPYVNPHEAVLQEAIAALGLAGVVDPDLRRARLLPMLRARRAFQHGSAAPDVLCLAPQGEFKARQYALRLPLDAAVLAMTDGFYRLVDPYGRYTIDELAGRCRTHGLAVLMDELRAFEAARASGPLAVKSADDASALLWTASRTQN
ncbi:hypothetical protein ACHAC9_18885 [Massilia sp. CMS3.1]|uniref:hypothetical protein n=1 Tax=Massilia sp. CMS3.1 TaxID=3373083 RepID=UPI003EE7B8C8